MVVGENICSEVVEQWRNKLPVICEGYPMEDIYIYFKTGILFQVGPWGDFCARWSHNQDHGTYEMLQTPTDLQCPGQKEKLWLVGIAKC